ncbi:SagB-type dehydrogenase family enzyme [Pseudomonas duriflava]|uniref:SagB-type dehydrogenase family enzyme n=1 Tax=Pseudomonas duriflava TaxID=459528 RepID=A0A562QFW3_9PSED|nr:SagB/ThcOx family dehydrogenase [Pseudomonas duriflava]TWI55583.1 SagB-type dehydrogenase family enzyme [Pseudomonas duriflava]
MSPEDIVRAYHEVSMHRREGYAPGPGLLDWANQPAPFRRYRGCETIPLLRRALEDSPVYEAVFAGPVGEPAPLDPASISRFFYDSLAISAWKEAGENRWALRINPSSGNLHPTEAYVLLPPGALGERALMAHYTADIHGLEIRAELPEILDQSIIEALPPGGFLLGLSSIYWREAWKYGERAWRYCQHDVGHALAAVSLSAAALGWETRVLQGVGDATLDAAFGLDRESFSERERMEFLIWVGPPLSAEPSLPDSLFDVMRALQFRGTPNRLSREYVCWPELERVAEACRAPGRVPNSVPVERGVLTQENPDLLLRPLLHQRRSAQSMDGRTGISAELLFDWLRRTLPARSPVPFATLGKPAQVDLLLFVHRVVGLTPGLYWLARSEGELTITARSDLRWEAITAAEDLKLFRLLEGDTTELSARLACGQDIASDGCLSLAMMGRFDEALAQGAWCYPRLFWEAGQIGQVLYLEAEAAGLSGTGIGCYFDPLVHDLLGFTDTAWQSLYHFTMGRATVDIRLTSLPAYPAPPNDFMPQ